MPADIRIYQREPAIEAFLAPYESALGEDLAGYRGHIYRVLSYALDMLGSDHPNRAEVEAALVFHDIGMWTARELAYLEPSIAEADTALAGHEVDHALVRAMIWNHHKLTPYHGPGATAVNAVRRADWIDATRRRRRMGMPRQKIATVEANIPEAGFHAALDRLAGELNDGNRLAGYARVLRRVFKV